MALADQKILPQHALLRNRLPPWMRSRVRPGAVECVSYLARRGSDLETVQNLVSTTVTQGDSPPIMGTYVKSPPYPPVQSQKLAGLLFSSTAVETAVSR